ncbi:MAG: PilZ domain-containing protein [Calditrichaeota bacterium]|nr:MAG: PilZ domain-containing protein [Calditrichota bacterium]
MTALSNNKKYISERRRSERFTTWMNTSFQDTDGHWEIGFVRDISSTGIHIVTLEPLHPGIRTALILENVTDQENVLISGTVIWKIQEVPQKNRTWPATSMGIQFGKFLPVPISCFIQ